ncbi:BRCT domain-containing protein, partial [Planctomycetota bacterium]
RRENLKPGLKFEVFQIRGGGKYVPKGIIEVKEVDAKLGYCYMLSLNNISDPIIPGDLVGSPIYDKSEKKKFFVAGDFEKYQNADIKKLIQESGGVVVEAINLYTDFVVLGIKNVGTARTDAIEMGVVMMNESQMLKYLMD